MIIVRRVMGRWAVLAVAVPLVVAGARRVSRAVAERREPSRATGLLRRTGDKLQRISGRSPKRRCPSGRR